MFTQFTFGIFTSGRPPRTHEMTQPELDFLGKAKAEWRDMGEADRRQVRTQARERWPILARLGDKSPIVVNQCLRLLAGLDRQEASCAQTSQA